MDFLIKIVLLEYKPQSTLGVLNRAIIIQTPSNIFWLLRRDIPLHL